MPSETRLDGCTNRFAHQFKRIGTLLQVAQPAVSNARDTVASEVLIEAVVVLAVACLEEYLTSLVGVATILQEDRVRRYIVERGNPDESRLARSCKGGALSKMAQRRVSFAKRGRRLEEVFDVIFGFGPWPDETSGVWIRDLVRVRNIIVHAGGWPNADHAADMETPGVVVVSNRFFHKLVLGPFVLPMVTAAGMVAVHVHDRLRRDPRFKL